MPWEEDGEAHRYTTPKLRSVGQEVFNEVYVDVLCH